MPGTKQKKVDLASGGGEEWAWAVVPVDAAGSVTSAATAYTTPAHTTLGVTATTQQALAANTNRTYAFFQNDGTNAIWLKLGAAAVADQGILLNPGGGAYEMFGGNLYRGAVNAIAAVAGPTVLLICEGV